jgi:hypothetical protein
MITLKTTAKNGHINAVANNGNAYRVNPTAIEDQKTKNETKKCFVRSEYCILNHLSKSFGMRPLRSIVPPQRTSVAQSKET